MDKTFHLDGDFLHEDARMEKPVPPQADNQDEYARLYAKYNRLRYAYNQHIDSLARYPLAPRHDWPKKEGLIEDVDFEILIDVTGFAGADFAKPLRQPVAEERTQDELWRELVDIIGSENTLDDSRLVLATRTMTLLSKTFHLTLK